GEAAQSASTANSAKQTATQQAEIATTKAGEAAQSASTANSAKQTATQQAEIATIKAGEVNDIKNEMIGVVEDLQLDPLSIIASQELAKKLNISDTQDLLTSNDTTKPLSANQGRVLKEFIDAINEILSSDDTTLDELQEIVSFIKQNKSTLDNLSVNNIAGLEIALNDKLSINGKAQSASIADSATTAATATKLETARTITISGAVTGTANFDGSENINITTTSADQNAIGSFILAAQDFTNSSSTYNTVTAFDSSINYGDIVQGSSIRVSGAFFSTGGSSMSSDNPNGSVLISAPINPIVGAFLTGTWKCLGIAKKARTITYSGSTKLITTYLSSSLFVRIA
ncbi:hypothetical protein, partial [Aliarcobacter butzleri]